jgi:hypothetical protein
VSELTTDKLTALLHQKADAELNQKLSYLEKCWEKDDAFKVRTKSEHTNGPHITIRNDTWIPGLLITVREAIFEAMRDKNRERYVAQWLRKVDETLDSVNDLHGGAQ